LLQLESENETLRLQYYLTLIQQGRADEALAAAQIWAAQLPGRQNRLKILTFLYRWAGQNDQAAQRLRQCINSAPNDHDLRFDLVDTLCESGSYDEAEKVLASVPQKGNWLPLRLSAQVKIDITRGECQRALARIDNLAQDKKSPEVEQLKVEILASCGEVQKAVERIEKLIEENPDEDVGRLWYSNFLAQREKTDEAVALLETLLQKQPDNALLKNNLAYSLIESNRDPQRSRRLLEESLHAEPESGPTLDSMGWLYYKEGKFEEALGYIYQAAATMATPDPEVLDHLGDTVYRLGRHRQALQYWQQAVTVLEHRLPAEKNVRNDKERIEGKIRQLNAGKAVTIPGLFGE
jgi:tetratricopeptide (TPR) repeat protein